MHPLIHRFAAHHEPRRDWREHGKSALAAGATVTLIGWLSAPACTGCRPGGAIRCR